MQVAIAYIRVSGQRQVTEGNSLASQEKLALSHVVSRGYSLDRLFVERGESAKSENRTVLQEMLAYCRQNAGKIDVLLFPKVDRLARSTHDYTNIKDEMGRLGIRFESIGEQFDNTPAGRLTEFMLAAFAQFDNEVRAERSKGGMIQAVTEGRFVWKAPIGYRNTKVNGKGTIEPDHNSELIASIFQRIASGVDTLASARQWLGENGIAVSKSHLHEMIYNKAYIGVIEAFGMKARAMPPFTPLVDANTFFAAQVAIERKKPVVRSFSRENGEFPLKGTLRCECGKYMTACWSKGNYQHYRYYRCMSCRRMNLSATSVERLFVAELDRFRPNESCLSSLGKELEIAWEQQTGSVANSRKRIAAEINNSRKLQASLALKNAKGVIPDKLAHAQIEGLERQIGLLEREFSSLQGVEQNPSKLLECAVRFLTSMGQAWTAGTPALRKSLQSFLYPNGIVYRKDKGLRTRDYPVLEHVKCLFSGFESDLVDPESPGLNKTQELMLFLQSASKFAESLDEQGLELLDS